MVEESTISYQRILNLNFIDKIKANKLSIEYIIKTILFPMPPKIKK